MKSKASAAPNMRVQRTRSSPSAPRSPLTRCPLGRMGLVRLGVPMLVILCVVMVIGGCSKRVHTYTLAAGTEPGEVVIEFANPACKALPTGGFTRAIEVPASRYVCTSDPMFPPFTLEANLYYQRTADGGRRRLRLDKEIFAPATFASGQGQGSCQYVGERFFFAPNHASVKNADPVPLYLLHHDRACAEAINMVIPNKPARPEATSR